MKNLIPLLLLLVTLQANAITVKYSTPMLREDGAALTLDEIAGYRIYWGTNNGDYLNTVAIDDNSINSYELDLPTDLPHYFVVTAIDTDGRESLYSQETYVPPITIMDPNIVTGITVVADALITNKYKISWIRPTTFEDGLTDLPPGAIVKQYLFDNGVWIKDLAQNLRNYSLVLSPGDHLFEMEVEIVVDGKRAVSERSDMVAITVPSSISLPSPPFDVQFNLPPGYKAVVDISPL